MDGQGMAILLLMVVASTLADLPSVGEFNCVDQWDSTTSCDKVICPEVKDCLRGIGKLLVDPSYPCSCCQYCLYFLNLNETCNVYSDDNECGPGLECQQHDDEYRCMNSDTECIRSRTLYDQQYGEGTIGMYVPRPKCDENGDFVAKKCQPDSSCYCVDMENQRIFGETPPNNASVMTCECSRDHSKALDMGFRSLEFPHCLPNGNYDSLQCVDLACYCIDTRNLTITTSLVPIFVIEELPCFDPEVHYNYYKRPCEMEKWRIDKLKHNYILGNVSVLGLESPDCSPDGYYQPVRKTESSTYCADPLGVKIDDYQITGTSSSNCACARTRNLLRNLGIPLPQCCSDGSYQKYQCRGGVCFCVDSNTGDQIDLEVQSSDVKSLKCYKRCA